MRFETWVSVLTVLAVCALARGKEPAWVDTADGPGKGDTGDGVGASGVNVGV